MEPFPAVTPSLGSRRARAGVRLGMRQVCVCSRACVWSRCVPPSTELWRRRCSPPGRPDPPPAVPVEPRPC